jgi:formylglycine-generating enzyme required for sulfatase activity
MSMAQIVRLFIGSPSDVATERSYVADVAAALNHNMADERDVQFKVVGWETDARARVHKQGAQGPIDEDLPVEQCDIVVGILWKRLGTPIREMGGETGTEHEIRAAIAASRQSGRPEVVLCINKAPYFTEDEEEIEQAALVVKFRKEIRGLELAYNGAADFRDKIRDYLEKYLIQHHRVTPGRVPAAIGGDPTRYVKALREETSHFDVQGLKFGDNRAYRFSIEEFYIPLTTSSSTGADEAKRGEMRAGPIPLQEAMLAHRKLLVVGDPGSGKSTFLKRVAFELCKEWAEGAALPVRIEAAVLSTYIAQQHTKTGPADAVSPDWIPVFLGAQCAEKNRELSADYFRAKLKVGGCHVLIDGLDETPDEASRVRLAALIRQAAAAFDGCRFVVTSRPEGKVPIADFEEALIGDLEPEAIRAFLGKVAKQLYASDETKERQFREELEGAVNGRREIRKMTRNPVMLTALAVLQHNNVKLPEKRVDLYGSILEWLSKQRAKPGRMPASDCLLRLRELALEMQRHEEGRKKQVPLAWAGEKLMKGFASREAAERFLRAEQADSGIVVSRGPEIAYWHLTFQEYLAALEIAGWEDKDQYKLLLGRNAKIYRPEWRETVLLYGGLLFKAGAPKVDALLRKLLDKMGKQSRLADRAKCVGLIGALLKDLVGYEVTDERYGESLRRVMDIFEAKKSKEVPFKDRLAAAEALGQAGDPRVANQEWVTIPATTHYWIGAQKKNPKGRNYDEEAYDDETLREVNLAAFRIGKYPVTVVQYLSFVEEGTAPDREPERWEEQQEHPNWPVVNVTWHQAAAYCEWAGGRLPTAEEWERAARGPKSTKYPWGNDDIDPSRANYEEGKIGHPTPVGLFPCGVSAEGVCDLIGNVLEWTASEWLNGSGMYVWRGGSFNFFRGNARSSCRDGLQPNVQFDGLGFRLAGGIEGLFCLKSSRAVSKTLRP